jgi:excisionase family DNA binding protein
VNPKSKSATRLAVASSVVPQPSAAIDPTLPEEILPLRLKTVAQLTDMSEKTVRRWIQHGLLRSHKLGGARVVRKCDLRTFLDQQSGASNKERP